MEEVERVVAAPVAATAEGKATERPSVMAVGVLLSIPRDVLAAVVLGPELIIREDLPRATTDARP
jgi:hypothetical protein